MELDLPRGQRAEDALDMLERYLEKAYMAGLPFECNGHTAKQPRRAGRYAAALKPPAVAHLRRAGQKKEAEG